MGMEGPAPPQGAAVSTAGGGPVLRVGAVPQVTAARARDLAVPVVHDRPADLADRRLRRPGHAPTDGPRRCGSRTARRRRRLRRGPFGLRSSRRGGDAPRCRASGRRVGRSTAPLSLGRRSARRPRVRRGFARAAAARFGFRPGSRVPRPLGHPAAVTAKRSTAKGSSGSVAGSPRIASARSVAVIGASRMPFR